jgi:hypothetical protein
MCRYRAGSNMGGFAQEYRYGLLLNHSTAIAGTMTRAAFEDRLGTWSPERDLWPWSMLMPDSHRDSLAFVEIS